jgi:hypothetical protein
VSSENERRKVKYCLSGVQERRCQGQTFELVKVREVRSASGKPSLWSRVEGVDKGRSYTCLTISDIMGLDRRS